MTGHLYFWQGVMYGFRLGICVCWNVRLSPACCFSFSLSGSWHDSCTFCKTTKEQCRHSRQARLSILVTRNLSFFVRECVSLSCHTFHGCPRQISACYASVYIVGISMILARQLAGAGILHRQFTLCAFSYC